MDQRAITRAIYIALEDQGCAPLTAIGDVTLGSVRHEALTPRVMAPFTGVRVGEVLRLSCEEILDGFGDVVCHAHELNVRWQQASVQRHEALHDLCRVAQTERERCRSASGKDLRGERFPSEELRH